MPVLEEEVPAVGEVDVECSVASDEERPEGVVLDVALAIFEEIVGEEGSVEAEVEVNFIITYYVIIIMVVFFSLSKFM